MNEIVDQMQFLLFKFAFQSLSYRWFSNKLSPQPLITKQNLQNNHCEHSALAHQTNSISMDLTFFLLAILFIAILVMGIIKKFMIVSKVRQAVTLSKYLDPLDAINGSSVIQSYSIFYCTDQTAINQQSSQNIAVDNNNSPCSNINLTLSPRYHFEPPPSYTEAIRSSQSSTIIMVKS